MSTNHARPTVLVVDDNPQIRSFLAPALEDAGFACIEAADGAEALHQAEARHPDAIVLDIELGDGEPDGLDVCRQLRNLGMHMPVIFLTVRSTVQDMEAGLRVAGPGSDYVRKLDELKRLQVGDTDVGNVEITVKSPDTRELIARIRARLPNETQDVGSHLRLDRKRNVVERLEDDLWGEVRLQPLEYRLLVVLIDADGAAVGTWDLYERAIEGSEGGSGVPADGYTDAHKNRIWVTISSLRKKIDPASGGSHIHNVHGIGYRFRPEAA